ncbi:ABC transporter substrate-binding protein [Pigmentibacter sp. JX0631]|uniref:ABC transporter substrate-binding protein n=1 Tax=Pigmentibacter sp. JX0631 TaxID=2976982 RepID=UPI0024696E55|nr:ABC transporter substrate-binding protein [Pigmentibacter sp. JX0631]WGL61074.1 ABC transporter substrate-binding protein [Pigmentibacter sp. JX0631]
MKIKLFAFIVSIFFIYTASAIKITFLVPGKSNEDFWVTAAEFTRAAAVELGFDYEVLYAERDRENMIDLVYKIASETNKPDFVLIVNEKNSAPQMLKILNNNNIKTFLVHVDLTDDQKKVIKYPRSIYKNWIGTVVADNVPAGYQIMNEMYKNIPENLKSKKMFKLIAINGDKETKTSLEREKGLYKFLNENKSIQLLQIIAAEWDRDIAYQKTNHMFDRYKDIDFIWAANDPIALGALKAVYNHQKLPGKNIYIGGLNWSKESLEEIKKGTISTSLGGHFINGACAIAVIFDYLKGIDINSSNYEMKINFFSPIGKKEVDEYFKYLDKSNWNKINFKKYTKFYNKNLKEYKFNPKEILKDYK